MKILRDETFPIYGSLNAGLKPCHNEVAPGIHKDYKVIHKDTYKSTTITWVGLNEQTAVNNQVSLNTCSFM